MTRITTLSLLGLFMLFGLGATFAHRAGLRLNTTDSFPKGFYWLERRSPRRGDLVEFATPDTEVFRQAAQRGYISESFLFGRGHLLKRLVAVEGDVVTIGARGVSVNGEWLPNSKPRKTDGQGRSMPKVTMDAYRLRNGEILLMSEYSPASFDARYFGIQSATELQSVGRR